MLSWPSPDRLILLAPRACFPLPGSWHPAPHHPLQPGPGKARLFWKNAGRWQNVRSSSSLQTGAPISGQTVAVFACPQRPVFSFQARRSRAVSPVGGRQAGRRTSPSCGPTGERHGRTGRRQACHPPSQAPPPCGRAVRLRAAEDHDSCTSAATQDIPPGEMEFTL